MSYRVEILRRAAKALSKLPERDYGQVRDTIRDLGVDPRPPGCKKLVGRDGWRIRVGRYRVIYEIEDAVLVVTVLDVGHRKDILRVMLGGLALSRCRAYLPSRPAPSRPAALDS